MRGEDRVLELQEVDSTIDRFEARRAELESGDELLAAREDADQAEAHLGEVRLAIDGEAREQRRLEHDIETLEQKAAAEEKRMYDGSIVNQKELEALQHEIANIKQRRGRFEDDLLERMERLEELQRLAREAEEALAAARERRETVGAQSQAELERMAADLADLRTARDKLSPEVDEELLELYEELRRSKKGVGAAAVIDGVCQGCHQTLSAVERERLKHADIKRCEYCRRILVFA
jgi:uncharacterized protein